MALINQDGKYIKVYQDGRYEIFASEDARTRQKAAPSKELILAKYLEVLLNLEKQEELHYYDPEAFEKEYSPWAATTIRHGFVTAPGGHRIGICGQCAIDEGKIRGIAVPTSLCLRVARDFPGISCTIENPTDSLLIVGPPGSGKTTLLRDLIRMISDKGAGSIGVVDEREELFPTFKGQACFYAGKCTDIVSGCGKSEGIEVILRCMNPHWIAMDEITAAADCDALLHAGWCGVNLLATAHAASVYELKTRLIYRPLLQNNLFSRVLVLHRDKSWTIERMHV